MPGGTPIFDELAGRTLTTHGLPPAPDPPTQVLPTTRLRPPPPVPPPPMQEHALPRRQQPAHVQTKHPQRKLGRLNPYLDEVAHPRLKLGHYLRADLPTTIPDVVDYSGGVTEWGMMGNDLLGDCTAAAAGHASELWTFYGAGAAWTPTDDQVIEFYSGSTGYDPSDPSTDQGGVMQDVLGYWRSTGLAGHKLAAYFQVDPSDEEELRSALWLFGCVNIGFSFPAFAMDQFDAGQPWDLSRSPRADTRIEGGHCVLLVGMNTGGNYSVITWGQVQEVTPRFWARYMVGNAGEAWAMADQEWVANDSSTAPGNELDVATLNADFEAMTGQPGPFVDTSTPPPPSPAPEPAPVPEPSPVPAPVPSPSPGADNAKGDLLRGLAGDLDSASLRLRELADLEDLDSVSRWP